LDLFTHRKEILRRSGAIIEKPDVYKFLTAFENMKLFATLSGVKPTQQQLMDQLEKVGLAERAHSKVKTYSQGMKQRLGIAVALVHNPDLVILDEPMNGLDPQGMADVRNLIHHLSKDLGKTIFISSHLLSEMEQVADSLLIIHRGKKMVEGNMQELLNPELSSIEIETDSADELKRQLLSAGWNGTINIINGQKLALRLKRDEVPVLISRVGAMNVPVYSIRRKHSLEDYFLSVTSQ
jgi:ABC-type multidrug transport system ATPase subunit